MMVSNKALTIGVILVLFSCSSITAQPHPLERQNNTQTSYSTTKLSSNLLGRKDLVPCPPSVKPSKNTTLPFSLQELGWPKDQNQRRNLLATPVQDLGTCRARLNFTFVKGGLENGALRVKNVQSAAGCCAKCLRLPTCHAWTWSSRTRICYPKGKTGWTAVPAANIVSGVVIRSGSTPDTPSSSGDRLIWSPTLHINDNGLQNNFAKETKATDRADYKYVVADPTGSSNAPVLKIVYLKGHWAPNEGPGGGVLFYAWPEGRNGDIGEAVRLEYEVYFPKGFTFRKGGKLPGLQGGATGCGGGGSAEKCFSVRLMWRRSGDGEAYMYLPNNQPQAICNTPGTVCDGAAGTSLMRGAFSFTTGKWIKIAITVRLNDPGKPNGIVEVAVDGKTEIEYSRVLYRNTASLKVQSFWLTSWFGGSDISWAPVNDMEAYFRNFKIYALN